MATKIINTRVDLANYDQDVELNGESFTFQFRFNDRDQSYTISIIDAAGERLHSGVRVVDGIYLALRGLNQNKPAGLMLIVPDGTDLTNPPILGELGDSVDLMYLEDPDA